MKIIFYFEQINTFVINKEPEYTENSDRTDWGHTGSVYLKIIGLFGVNWDYGDKDDYQIKAVPKGRREIWSSFGNIFQKVLNDHYWEENPIEAILKIIKQPLIFFKIL